MIVCAGAGGNAGGEGRGGGVGAGGAKIRPARRRDDNAPPRRPIPERRHPIPESENPKGTVTRKNAGGRMPGQVQFAPTGSRVRGTNSGKRACWGGRRGFCLGRSGGLGGRRRPPR